MNDYLSSLPGGPVIFPTLYSWLGTPAKIIGLLLVAGLLMQTVPARAVVPPFGVNQCPADRMYEQKGNTSLGCTAADVSITRIAIYDGSGTSTGIGDNTTSPNACISGASPHYDFDLTVNFATPERWDIGLFLVHDGKDPHKRSVDGGPATCSVGVLATPENPTAANPAPVFEDLDGITIGYPQDTCGDGSGAINGGTGSGHHRMNDVPVLCAAHPLSQGKLVVPFVVSWDNQSTPSGGICSSNLDPVPNTVSKCNSPNQALAADVVQETLEVLVVPLLSKTDHKTVTSVGETNVYDITMQNVTGIILTNTMFTDPAVNGLTVSSVTCSPVFVAPATTNGVCPAAGLLTVANLQGGGILLPDQPVNSSLTFTVTAQVNSAAIGTITNTARVTVTAPSILNPGQTISGYSEIADTDTLAARPTLTLVKTVTNNDGGTKAITDFSLIATGATTTISGITATAAVTSVPVPAGNYVLSETFATGGAVTGYAGTWNCTGQTSFAGSTVTINAGQDVTCTINNNDDAAKLTIRKITKAATAPLGAGTFKFNGSGADANGIPTGDVLTATTVTTNSAVATAQVALGSSGVNTIFTETPPDGTWVITAASCTDSNGAVTGNGTSAFEVPFNQTAASASVSGITIPANGIAIPAAKVKGGAVLVCDVTNARSTLKLTKSTQPAGDPNTFTLSIDGVIRTSPTVVDGGSTLDVPVTAGATHTIGEDAIVPDNFFTGGNKYQLIYTCRDVYGNTTVAPGYFDVSTLGNAAYTSGNLAVFAALSAAAPLDANNLQINCTLRNNSGVTLAIKKVANPTDATVNFPFTLTGKPNFSLSGANDNISNVTTIPVTKNTIYTLTEDLSGLTDWVFVSSSCNINGVVTSPGNPATVSIPNDVSVAAQCFFTNKRKTALSVKKTVIGNSTDQFDLKVNATSVTNPRTGSTGTFINGDSGRVVLGSGSFTPTVSEVINTNYNTTLTCTDNTTGLVVSGFNGVAYTGGDQSVALADSQQVTCEFTNRRKTLLTVAKTVVGPLVQGSDKFVISINKGGPSLTTATTSSTATDINTIPGPGKYQVYPTTPATEVYTFAEQGALGSPDTDLSKYTTTHGCTNATVGGTAGIAAGTAGTTVALTPAIGDDFTCTFTNTAKPPKVTLSKTTRGNPGVVSPSFAFDLAQGVTPIGSGSTTTTTEDLPATVGVYPATAGEAIKITESTIPAGWTLAAASCSGLNGADVVDTSNLAAGHYITIPLSSVIAGADIQCNFTNQKAATIRVKKTLIPNTGTFDLKVNGVTIATGVGDTGASVYSTTVTPGTAVAVSEQGAGGTDLNKYSSGVTCKDSTTGLYLPGLAPSDNIIYTPTVPAIFTAPSFIPSGGQQIECTFSNSLQPKLRLVKEVVGIVNMNDQFTISISPSANTGASVNVDAIDGTRSTATISDTDGDGAHVYTFTETGSNLPGYSSTYICTNAKAGSPTVIPLVATAGTTFTITPIYGDDIVCTFKNTAQNASIVLKKALSVARDPADNQFKMQIKDGGAEVAYTSNVTTTGAGTALGVGTGVAAFTTSTAKTYTLGEEILNTPGGIYEAKIICTNNDIPVATPPLDGSVLFDPATTTKDLALNLGDNYICTFVNAAPVVGAPLTITKTTVGGTGSFNFTVVNGATTLPVFAVDTTSTNPKTSAIQTLPNIGSSATVTESVVPGWTTTSGSCTDDAANPTKWPAIGQIVTIPTVEAGKTYTCSFTNTQSGFSITGMVFKDSGTGGGTANNGIKDGSEAGIPQVIVKLTDCASVVYSSTTTDGAGNYSLSTAGVPAGNVCIEETNIAGYLSTGANFPVLAPVATYDRTTDKITFSLVAATSYSSMNFADVPINRFLTDGTKTGTAGSSVSYPHLFVAGSGGKVSFSLPGATAIPTIAGWTEVVYRDVNCDGVLDTGAGDIQIITTPITEITVAEGERVCLIHKEFIPGNAPTGAGNLVPINADFTYTNAAAPSLTATYTRQDVTRVTDVALELLKSVRNVSTGGAWATSNTARSGDILEYRINYVNNGLTPIQNLIFNDATPAYTLFVSAACGISPLGLTCTTPVPIQPSVNGTGGISWTFTGSLVSGESGTVTYQVIVE